MKPFHRYTIKQLQKNVYKQLQPVVKKNDNGCKMLELSTSIKDESRKICCGEEALEKLIATWIDRFG